MTYKAAKAFAFITLLATRLLVPAEGQDRSDWQSLGQLQAGDGIHLLLKDGAGERRIPQLDSDG
jgi:hypothetical protein